MKGSKTNAQFMNNQNLSAENSGEQESGEFDPDKLEVAEVMWIALAAKQITKEDYNNPITHEQFKLLRDNLLRDWNTKPGEFKSLLICSNISNIIEIARRGYLEETDYAIIRHNALTRFQAKEIHDVLKDLCVKPTDYEEFYNKLMFE